MPSKYDTLSRHLIGVDADRTRLSFAEIERILGFSLPDSARQYAPWWANTGGSHIQANSWMSAGWRTSQLDIGGERVTFERAAPKASPLVGARPSPQGVAETSAAFHDDDVIVIRRSAFGGGAIRMLEDYCDEGACDLAAAVTGLLNAMALERRRELINWFRANSPRVPGDSADLIREDRDAR